jgi:hypothetical protein
MARGLFSEPGMGRRHGFTFIWGCGDELFISGLYVGQILWSIFGGEGRPLRAQARQPQ